MKNLILLMSALGALLGIIIGYMDNGTYAGLSVGCLIILFVSFLRRKHAGIGAIILAATISLLLMWIFWNLVLYATNN